MRAVRRVLGASQQSIANDLLMSRSHVARLECGTTEPEAWVLGVYAVLAESAGLTWMAIVFRGAE